MSTETTEKKRGTPGRKPIAVKVQSELKGAIESLTFVGDTAKAWYQSSKDDDARTALKLAVEACELAHGAISDLPSLLSDYAPIDARGFGFAVGDAVNVKRAHRDALLVNVDDPCELTDCIVHKIVDSKIVLRTASGARFIVKRSQILPVNVAEDAEEENGSEASTSNETTEETSSESLSVQ